MPLTRTLEQRQELSIEQRVRDLEADVVRLEKEVKECRDWRAENQRIIGHLQKRIEEYERRAKNG